MTISASSGAAALTYDPVLDADSAAGLLEAVQAELADQVGEGMVGRAKLVNLLRQALNAETSLAANLRARAAAVPGSSQATLGANLTDADALEAQLALAGVSTGNLQPEYLWVTRTKNYDGSGNLTSVTLSAAWRTDKVSTDGNYNGHEAIASGDWAAAASTSPDAKLLTGGSGAPPTDSTFRTSTAASAGGSTTTDVYCYENEAQVIVDKSTLSDWATQVEALADKSAVELAKLTSDTRSDLSVYQEIVDQTADFMQKSRRDAQNREAALPAQRQADELRLQQRNADLQRQIEADAGASRNAPDAPSSGI